MSEPKLIFEWEVPDDWPNFSGHDDLADAYRVYEDTKAAGGVVVEARFNGEWCPNPWSCRPLIRHLLMQAHNKAHDALYLAARMLLKLAKPHGDDEMIIHEDNYKDLAEAVKTVYQAKRY